MANIIEARVPGWVIASIQKGTQWDHLPVRPAHKVEEEGEHDWVPVLIVPVAPGSVTAATAKIKATLNL